MDRCIHFHNEVVDIKTLANLIRNIIQEGMKECDRFYCNQIGSLHAWIHVAIFYNRLRNSHSCVFPTFISNPLKIVAALQTPTVKTDTNHDLSTQLAVWKTTTSN